MSKVKSITMSDDEAPPLPPPPPLSQQGSPSPSGFKISSRPGPLRKEDVFRELMMINAKTSQLRNTLKDIQAAGADAVEAQYMIMDEIAELQRPRSNPVVSLGGSRPAPGFYSTVDSYAGPGTQLVHAAQIRQLTQPGMSLSQSQGKIFDYDSRPKRSDFLDSAMFGSLQVDPTLDDYAFKQMPGYAAVPLMPPPSTKTPFTKYVEPDHGVPLGNADLGGVDYWLKPLQNAIPEMETPVEDYTKKFSIPGY